MQYLNYRYRETNLAKAISILLLALSFGFQSAAVAGDHYENNHARDGKHQSVIHIAETGSRVARNVHIGLGKSVLVEFPREIRDVLVSNPAAVDAVVLSSNRVFLLARTLGDSNAFFFDSDGNQFATLEIFVQRETAGLKSILKRLIPGSDIEVEMLNQSVLLTGSVRTPADSVRAGKIAQNFVAVGLKSTVLQENEGTVVDSKASGGAAGGANGGPAPVINMLSVEAGEQVMLRVKVAEVKRQLLKQFGVNLGAAINSGNFTTRVLTANALPLTTAAGLGGIPVPGVSVDPNTGVSSLALFNDGPTAGDATSFGNSGVNGFANFGSQRIAHALRALERDGLVRTLAEPSLTAVSGESAKFLAGGEFPVPVVDSDGGLSVQFKEFGVGVAFTPFVLSEGRISLKIDTEVSELSSDGSVVLNFIQIPSLQTRKATSTVELPSGGSLAIAGLLSETTQQNIDGFPKLKDIPILGTLFRSQDYVKNETELIIIVTPYIVRPVAPKDLSLPTSGLVDATDDKRNFFGHLNKVYGRSEASGVVEGGLKGDYGFIVE